MKCEPTGAGRSVFSAGAQLHCDRAGNSSTIRIVAVRPHGRRLLLRIQGVDDADSAAEYAGAVLYAPRERLALGENEYFDDDLIGCVVEDLGGRSYGSVERVEHYPSSDMLIVEGRMVPLVRAIVTELDVERGRIVIDPPAGLFEL